jgi:hypothetical protein
VTLTNNEATDVLVSGISSSNREITLSQVSLPQTLPAGQSLEVSVFFTPTATGWTGGDVVFTSDLSNPIFDLKVAGTGVKSEAMTASPSTLSFGQVAIGSSSTEAVVLTNDGFSNVTISALQATGSGFSMSGPALPLTLSAGQNFTVNVTFTPQAAGMDGGSLFVTGPRLNIPLTGTGTATQYSVSLSWNYSPDVVGYNVYRCINANGKYSKINSNLDANTAYTDSTVVSGQIYDYVNTAVNSEGQESAYSTPAQAVIP